MRFSPNVAFGLFSVALMGFVRADELDDKLGDAAKVAEEVISSATPSAVVEKPTFTVSRTELPSSRYFRLTSVRRSLFLSPPPSTSSSPMTGIAGGRSPTRRRLSTRLVTRSGRTLASGRSRSPTSSRASRATRVWVSRLPQRSPKPELDIADNHVVVKNAAAHHAISAKFDKPIDNTDKTLVVQYEVKMQST